jgi:hypothetical protein
MDDLDPDAAALEAAIGEHSITITLGWRPARRAA